MLVWKKKKKKINDTVTHKQMQSEYRGSKSRLNSTQTHAAICLDTGSDWEDDNPTLQCSSLYQTTGSSLNEV